MVAPPEEPETLSAEPELPVATAVAPGSPEPPPHAVTTAAPASAMEQMADKRTSPSNSNFGVITFLLTAKRSLGAVPLTEMALTRVGAVVRGVWFEGLYLSALRCKAM